MWHSFGWQDSCKRACSNLAFACLKVAHPPRPFHPTHRFPPPLQAALDNLRWGADYLMACHTQPDAYVAQISEPGAGEVGVVER